MNSHIAKMLTQRNELLDYIMPPEGFKPAPWYKRWAQRFGNSLINLGIKLGGSYDYD